MFSGVGKPSWLPHVWSLACVVVAVSLALCSAALATPTRGWTHSAHPRGDRMIVPSARQRDIAEHKEVYARSLRLIHSRNRARAAMDVASGVPFQRGDVFLTGSGTVQEYSPTGQLVQTVAGTSGAYGLCFDPNGTRLVVPGVGLFDRFGNVLPS